MPLRMVMTGRMSGPDIPAQLRLLALHSEQVRADAVPLAQRMEALERQMSELPQAAEAQAA